MQRLELEGERVDTRTEAVDGRAEWQRPELRRIEAGSAEVAPVNTVDAIVVS